MGNATPKIYISGPISSLSEAEYLPLFADAAEYVNAEGYEAVNPLYVDAHCGGENCESDLKFEDGRYMHTWQCYMKADIVALMNCDAIFMIPDWRTEDSKGAMLELELAQAVGIPVAMIDDHGRLVW